MTKETCDLCNGQLRPIYKPDGTKRGLTVHVCGGCGLLQSLPRIDTVEDKTPSISYRADTGNVRVGKGHRAAANLEFIKSVMEDAPKILLDVGSGRGDFAREFEKWNPEAVIVGIEPDESVIDYRYAFASRIEDINLTQGDFGGYNLIYLSHTLEHLKSPLATLKRLHGALADDGYLFVEVPNIMGAPGVPGVLEMPDVFEEAFIDKHLYHYSLGTLYGTVRAAGFEIMSCLSDAENLSVMCQKGGTPVLSGFRMAEIEKLLNVYDMKRQGNLAEIADVAAELNEIPKRYDWGSTGCFVYGVGRLFDALCRGGLDFEQFTLVDKYLDRSLFPELDIIRPGELAPDEDFIFIASRGGYKEMAAEARRLCPGALVWGLGDFQ